jgi:decaprenylphospho-beta-D-ribofuranose 2-oxidase
MLVEAVPCRTLRDAVDTMRNRADGVDALYSWHDFNRRSGFGRGVVFVERFVEGRSRGGTPKPRDPKRRGRLALWNPLTTRLALGTYRLVQRIRTRRTLAIHRAMFPIDGLEGYYAAFGRRGFREYQLIVPYETWDEFARALEPWVTKSGVPVTLASLKLFRGARRHLAFAGEGVCLAIDVPASERALSLFRALDDLAVRCGAVVNLSKDSRVSSDLCRAVFPGHDDFSRALQAFDPKRRFQSELRERLDV